MRHPAAPMRVAFGEVVPVVDMSPRSPFIAELYGRPPARLGADVAAPAAATRTRKTRKTQNPQQDGSPTETPRHGDTENPTTQKYSVTEARETDWGGVGLQCGPSRRTLRR